MGEESAKIDEHAREQAFLERSRALFEASVEGLDSSTCSQLTQARYRALEAAGRGRRPGFWSLPLMAPLAGVTGAAVLAVSLWLGGPLPHHGGAEPQATLEDLDLVAASDETSGDALEMLQEDPEFYSWAEKAANNEPPA
jgi:hypothetical protein